jgi:hypothetical protein
MSEIPVTSSKSLPLLIALSIKLSSRRLKCSLQHYKLTSDALEISSRRKISLLLYREWIIISINLDTSAWNSNFSAFVLRVLGFIDSLSLHATITHMRSGKDAEAL